SSGCGTGSVTTVTFTAVDNCVNTSRLTSTVTVVDTTAPLLTVPAPISLECNAAGGVPKSDPRIVAWLGKALTSDTCDAAPTLADDAPALFASGCGPGAATTVTFTAKDSCGNVTQKTSTVTVADTTPPDVAGCALLPWDLETNMPRPPRPPSAPAS